LISVPYGRTAAASVGNRAPPHGARLARGQQAPASASGASNAHGASGGVLLSASDDDGGGFHARCASSWKMGTCHTKAGLTV
jgi:hypothetical protein